MKTQYYTAASLDGFIATVDDSLDWLFTLGDIADTSYPKFIKDIGALAMGSATYEWMLRHAVGPDAKRPEPWPYTQPTWIFTSRSLPTVPGADIRFARGDVRPVHAEMAQAAAGKNVWIVGGGELAGQFFDHGLLDEMFVQVGSVTLGAGKPLFPRSARAHRFGWCRLARLSLASQSCITSCRGAMGSLRRRLTSVWNCRTGRRAASCMQPLPSPVGPGQTPRRLPNRLRVALAQAPAEGLE